MVSNVFPGCSISILLPKKQMCLQFLVTYVKQRKKMVEFIRLYFKVSDVSITIPQQWIIEM